MSKMNEIDVDWAWSEFEPSKQQPWNSKLAAHLMRRAGFGASPAELQTLVKSGPGKSVQSIFSGLAEPADYLQQVDAIAHAALATSNPRQLSAWWMHRMLSTPAQLLEKTTLFWHGHFATSAAKVEDADLMYAQNNLLRKFALGEFGELLLEISRDPAMLIYLDSASNRKAHPNENYAREIMELFCLGEGQYTEKDIRELARCFTGWEVKRKKFRFNRYQHDRETKSFLGQTGNFGGEDGVRIVVSQPAAAEFIVSRLVRFFVMDEPAAPANLVAPLAQQLRDEGMTIEPVVKRILSSNLFYSSHSVGRKLKSPVEFVAGFLRSLDGSTSSFDLAEGVDRLGQGLFYPPSVKGWDGGRTWINSSTLLGRSNLIHRVLQNEKTRFGRTSLLEYLSKHDVTSSDELMSFLEASIMSVSISNAARQQVRDIAGDFRDEQKVKEAVRVVATLPEFQLG